MKFEDFGVKMKEMGIARQQNEFFFHGIPLLDFFKINPNKFTFMVAQKINDEKFALSFDFSEKILKQIFVKMASEKKVPTKKVPFFSNRFILNQAIYINIKATMGKEERDSCGDVFIPFIIEEVL
ncbi:hypothetical protein CYQ88_09900 [Hydrogenovibrio sp. SC-1]|uniref:hypothetical protein n=1 Tax=Hydrogenovibrio sp. SC-1 TaxID=2065820 RepID=UPI000C796E6B|nr:hypothetical protein [Hydrogenovibrio sp. SC-1]PLA73679.1 hypothetical protein CYQ88_09825 [Hydrogenovibrio sp. SC-1]PLA73694.1 hypothetical protein CYQ88_09900 [Hydrogenovibrio sp. SC-1]